MLLTFTTLHDVSSKKQFKESYGKISNHDNPKEPPARFAPA